MNGKPFQIAVIFLCIYVAHAALAADQPAAPPAEAAKADHVLIYEVDAKSKTGDKPVDMQQLATAVDQRINTGWLRTALVEALPNQRLQITVIRPNAERVQRVTRAISAAGTLEFRILAEECHHKELIERAKTNEGAMVYRLDETAKTPPNVIPLWSQRNAKGKSL